jgi:hypothetical protein
MVGVGSVTETAAKGVSKSEVAAAKQAELGAF